MATTLGTKNDFTKIQKYLFTLNCCLAYTSFGVAFALFTNSLLDIKDNVHRTLEEASYGLIVVPIFSAISFIVSGQVFKVIDKRICLIFACLVAIVVCLAIPFIKSYILFMTSMAFAGISIAIIMLACNGWVLEIWRDKSNPYMLCLHFSFSLGLTLGPLVVAPFLSNKSGDDEPSKSTPKSDSSLLVPYAVAAGLFTLTAVYSTFMYLRKPMMLGGHDDVDENNSQDAASSCSDNEETDVRSSSLFTIILATVIFTFNQGSDNNAMSFAVEFIFYLKGDKKRGAFMAALFSGAHCATRFVEMFLARSVSAQFMIPIHLSIALMCYLAIYLFASVSSAILPVSFFLIVLGQSVVAPSLLSLFGQRIKMTSPVLSAISLSDSIASVSVAFLQGHFIEKNPMSFIISGLFTISMTLVLFFVFLYQTRNNVKSRKSMDQIDAST